jgi:glycosyltransferase involved in cell wall biosynthesis
MDSLSPLVTIVIPTFNREKFIQEALECSSQQTYKNIEILVIDNRSSDETVNIVRKFSETDERVKLYINDTNVGPLLNWKRGFELSSGELVKILWSDDLMESNYLEKTVPCLTSDVGFVVSEIQLGPSWKESDRYNYDLSPSEKGLASSFIKKSLVSASVPLSPGCALFRKKDLIQNVTLNNPFFASDRFKQNGAGPDMLFFLKASAQYKYFGFTSETKSFFREHEGSITISEKARLIGLDYAKARLLFAINTRNRLALGLYIEILLRDRTANKEKRFALGELLRPKYLIGMFEYFFLRSWYFAKRKLK